MSSAGGRGLRDALNKYEQRIARLEKTSQWQPLQNVPISGEDAVVGTFKARLLLILGSSIPWIYYFEEVEQTAPGSGNYVTVVGGRVGTAHNSYEECASIYLQPCQIGAVVDVEEVSIGGYTEYRFVGECEAFNPHYLQPCSRCGGEGSINSFADAGGGDVTATCSAPHGLSDGDYVLIKNTTNYNGFYTISNASGSVFDFTAAWAGTETGNWDLAQPQLTVTKTGTCPGKCALAGVYTFTDFLDLGSACRWIWSYSATSVEITYVLATGSWSASINDITCGGGYPFQGTGITGIGCGINRTLVGSFTIPGINDGACLCSTCTAHVTLQSP